MKNLGLRILPCLVAIGSLFLSGCIEKSTVIKVKRDGSGIIHERSYSVETDNIISFSSKKQKEKEAAEKETELPSEAALKQYASTLGAGVTFRSVHSSTNKKGWKGYEILYEFNDINTVRYARNTPKPESDDDKDDDKKKKGDGFTTTFAMVDGKLSIKLDRDDFLKADQVAVQEADSPTIDPYADTTGPSAADLKITSPLMNEEMMKTMTKGMRMGLFVQIDGEIAETTAAHRNGNLITLFNVDFGSMLENEGGMAAMNQLEHTDRSTLDVLADQLDGLDVDLQDPIEVIIK